MDNLNVHWMPRTAPEDKQLLLAVKGAWPMTASLHRQRMLEKVQALFAQISSQEALQNMAMSEEHFPELSMIAHNQPSRAWPELLMMSDLMDAALNLIKWQQEGALTPQQQKDLTEAMEDQSLASLIESL
ncbi:MAG: hypothetical protein H7335_04470 [Massilia sp.]|nr:hypothetical protein [Massilia sp.]